MLLLPFNYPAASKRLHTEITSLSHHIFYEIYFIWLHSKGNCVINIYFPARRT